MKDSTKIKLANASLKLHQKLDAYIADHIVEEVPEIEEKDLQKVKQLLMLKLLEVKHK
jgi:hypothetical protein